MKNLDLNAMGVVEMDARELKETDGGFPLLALIVAGVILVTGVVLLIDDIKHKRQFDPVNN